MQQNIVLRTALSAACLAAGAAIATLYHRQAMKELAQNTRFGMLSQTGMDRYLSHYSGAAVDVLFCDGDSFKALNDAGRLLGYIDVYGFTDRLVREAFSALRRSDRVVEVGQKNSGDEWIVLVPAGTGQGAADRLLATMKAIPNEHERAAIRQASGGAVETFSATIAVVGGVRGRAAIREAIALGVQQVADAKAAGRRGEVIV